VAVKNGVITFIFVFLVLITSCVSNRNVTNENQTTTSIRDIIITTHGSNNGIKLFFNYIPYDVNYMSVYLFNVTDNTKLDSFAEIKGIELENIKYNKLLICPFLIPGHEYIIYLHIRSNFEQYNFAMNAVSESGTYLVNNTSLDLLKNDNILYLSEMPIFSEEIIFCLEWSNFLYSVYILIPRDDSFIALPNAGFGEYLDELFFDFTDILENADFWNMIGTFIAQATVSANLIYDNITWTVGIVKSDNFIMSF
jgi:hypothetical protein